VLLGDGYYADRSAKQTTEILHRRGMELETQMEAIKATISDLEAEAKFFESTAAEASVRPFLCPCEEYISGIVYWFTDCNNNLVEVIGKEKKKENG
jgi:hypothetical protein